MGPPIGEAPRNIHPHRQLPPETVSGQRFTDYPHSFWELFSGFCGLSNAVQSKLPNSRMGAPLDIKQGQDLTDDDTFTAIVHKIDNENEDWVHMATPCQTFTRARRNDEHGSVRTLRSKDKPEGDPQDKLAVQGNLLAARSAAIAIRQWKRNKFFSIENPWTSYLWELKSISRVTALTGTKLVRMDQCAYGSPHKKPTGILTNAPWLFNLRVCGDVVLHDHVALQGRVWSYKENREVWYTSEAAEYPAGMCEAWVESWKSWLRTQEPPPRATAKLQGKYKNQLVNTLGNRLLPREEPKPCPSSKEVRERENSACIGGMRNPNKSVANSPSWKRLGAKMARILDECLDECQILDKLLERIRKDEVQATTPLEWQTLEAFAECAANKLALSMGGDESWLQKGPTGWRWKLVRAITELAEDQDVDIAEWLQGKTPLGIIHEIPNRGIFPPCDQTEAQAASAQFLATRITDKVDQNYKSFAENSKYAELEFQRLLEEKHVEKLGTWDKVKARWKDAMATKIALLIKEKADATVKVRFVVDMLRSGINGLTKMAERIVLPRGEDLIESILDLWETSQPCDSVELMVVDFVDAFFNLQINEDERGYVTVTDNKDYYVYKGLAFGLSCAPLLWGRVAAWLGRSAQAVSPPQRLRCQIYVDDPVIATIGTPQERIRALARVLLLWLTLGARLAWPKASLGTSVQWIGATYIVQPQGVTATIDAKRIQSLDAKAACHLASRGMTSGVRSFAGEMSWVAGVVPRLRPFVSMLYSAVHEMLHQAATGHSRDRPKELVFVKTISYPLNWLRHFFKHQWQGLRRNFWVADRSQYAAISIRTDASTTGLGAILIGPTGLPLAWWADVIRLSDRDMFKAPIGDPAFMAEFETLAVLISLSVWQTWLADKRITCLVQSDSSACLGAIRKLCSPSQTVNYIVAEISLRLESLNCNLCFEHYRNEVNLDADALSRLTEGKKVPAHLMHLKPAKIPSRASMFQAWPDKQVSPS